MKSFKLTSIWAPILLLSLAGCGGKSDKNNDTDPQPLPPLVVKDGMQTVDDNNLHYVGLGSYIEAGAGAGLKITDVKLVRDDAQCSAPQIQGIGFNAQLEGSGTCEYQYNVTSLVQGQQSQGKGKILLLSGTTAESVLRPLPLALTLGEEQTIDLVAELGADFPSDHSLNPNITLLGSGVATANAAGNTITFEATTVGLARIVYRLDSTGEDFSVGTVDISVSDEGNQPPVANNFVHPVPTTVDQTIVIDVSAYISDPDAGQTVQLIGVESFHADVAPSAPDDLSNTQFSFSSNQLGLHYVAYEVSDQFGGLATGIVEVTVGLDAFNLDLSDEPGVKRMKLSWTDPSNGASGVEYQVCERDTSLPDSCHELAKVKDTFEVTLTLSTLLNIDKEYFVRAVFEGQVKDSSNSSLSKEVARDMIGYFKAINADAGDIFGQSVAISGDGKTIAVGAPDEDSANRFQPNNNSRSNSGAVYIYRLVDDIWVFRDYIKPNVFDAEDKFGLNLVLSDDGNTLAVSTLYEDSSATGINGDMFNNAAINSGAAYVFRYYAGGWVQEAYIKASNTDADDRFGSALALSADGNTLAVSAPYEDSNATGINGNQSDNSNLNSGAIYLYRFGLGVWTQQAYIKHDKTDSHQIIFGQVVDLSADGNTLVSGIMWDDNGVGNSGSVSIFRFVSGAWSQQANLMPSHRGQDDRFGAAVRISSDGNIVAIGAYWEASNATGVDGDPSDNSAPNSGAAYIYEFDGTTWVHQAYFKASNTQSNSRFGNNLALDASGEILVVGALLEGSNARGFDGDQNNDSALNSGAAYIFERRAGLWQQTRYVKSSNTDSGDNFSRMSISNDGSQLVISGVNEDSSAGGIDGNQADNSAPDAGAVYLF